MEQENAEVIIVGGGIAGLSAAIYLGRAERDILVVDAGKSMARWEPDVENYLGFPEGIAGEALVRRGSEQASRYGARIMEDEIVKALVKQGRFVLQGKKQTYGARRVLITTGIFHLPPEIEGVAECLGHSLFFCKDCDGFRVRGKRIAIYGWTEETVEYALAMMYYSAYVIIVTDGKRPRWRSKHSAWIKEYHIPVYAEPIVAVGREGCEIKSLKLPKGMEVEVDALFTTRGDVYLNKLARGLGAQVDKDGQIVVDHCMRTSVKGVYAAGCVTPSNCQLIIAAGQGATAAQAINRDLLEESLATHSLRRFRGQQLRELVQTGSSGDRKTILETNRSDGPGRTGVRTGGHRQPGKNVKRKSNTYGKHRKNNRSRSARRQGLQPMDAIRGVSRIHGRRRGGSTTR
jgi:thioredoxin reductase (NADPH)